MNLLCNSKKYDEENNKKHKTSIDKVMNLYLYLLNYLKIEN